jgi:HK97 family phage major capsid protein
MAGELDKVIKAEFDKIGTGLKDIEMKQKNAIDAFEAKIGTKFEVIDNLEEKINLMAKDSDKKHGKNKKRGFENSAEFFSTVIEAGKNGMRPDQMDARLLPLLHVPGIKGARNAAGSDDAIIASNPDGGFTVPPAFLPTIMKLDPLAIQGDTGALTKKIPMQSQIVVINARVDKDHSKGSVTGGFQMYRGAEAATMTDSKSQYEQIELKTKKLSGVAYASEEILAMSPISFGALIQDGFATERIAKLNYERLNGNGVGEFLGVLKSPCLITTTKTDAQVAKTVSVANLFGIRARVWGYKNAVWMANQDVIPALASLDSSQYKLWQPSLREDLPDTLMGRPIIFDENLPSLGSAGDIGCYNWSEYLEGQYGGATFQESIHVRFVQNERAFRLVTYNDGAPWWRTALTPRVSTTSLSPFVILGARV